jgi:amino acid adenylation domain-containing protein
VSTRLQDLFFQTAKNSGERIAVEELSGKAVTYSGLEKMVREKVAFFHNFSIYKNWKGMRIVICSPKSIETVSLMLAILELGACYIPIDPEMPEERVNEICRNLRPHVFIGTGIVSDSGVNAISERPYLLPDGKLSATFFNEENHSEDLAYILYTSGSTGVPKGVCITHENALAFTDWSLNTFPVNENDRFSSIASFHFDLSVFDIYVSLACGGTVVLIDENTSRNARLLTEILSKKKISVTYATPSLLSLLLNYGKIEKYPFPDLRIVLFAGEVFPVKHLHGLMKNWNNARFFNLYGPTETNVCTWFEIPGKVDETRTEPYPIGKICQQLTGKISDIGELLISGPNVTSGYWKRDDLNAKAFVDIDGKKFYKTGDRVKEDKTGNLVYSGRVDRMIKKRGYRIEPEEIENVLLRMENIIEAAVVGGKDEDGYSLLHAYLSIKNSSEKSIQEIREHCMKYLPAYMIPEQIHFLGSLPKNSNGKIDLKSLEKLT